MPLKFPAVIRVTFANRDSNTVYLEDRAQYDEYMQRAKSYKATRIQVFETHSDLNLTTEWAIAPA
jgi:hypothetical protein